MSGGRVKRTHLRTAPKISVPVRSSIKREVASRKGVFWHKIFSPPAYSKTCAKDGSGLQEPSAETLARSDTATLVMTGDHWELLK